jgi:uncharacterized OsmC-like protein
MVTKANIVMVSGTQLLGTARNHTVVTDRPLEDGGTDTGFTSGEMLLLAIGSCASGSLRRHFKEQGTPCRSLSADVRFDTPVAPGRRDRIVIDLKLDDKLCANHVSIRTAALSGGVTSRIAAGSDMEVRINGKPCAG